ncbi:MAG: sugar phosphate nucleotidyltransferase [Bacteroidia bacterium]
MPEINSPPCPLHGALPRSLHEPNFEGIVTVIDKILLTVSGVVGTTTYTRCPYGYTYNFEGVVRALEDLNASISGIQGGGGGTNVVAGSGIYITPSGGYSIVNANYGTIVSGALVAGAFIDFDYLTEGPSSSVLLAKKYINNDTPLIVTNCDQIMEWDSSHFVNFINSTDKDGIVVTYNVLTEKNSYVKLDENGNAILFAEKKIISDYSLNGIHFWKKGSDFIDSAESMINKNIRVNNEFYIAPSYNEMVLKNKKIGIYHIDKNSHWSVGTPDDLDKYLKHANLQIR